MPIINLAVPNARGCGQLNKFSVRADGRDNNAFVYELQVVFTIASSAEADIVEELIPGAKQSYQRATERDDWKTQQTVIPDIEGANMELRRSSDDECAISGGAEIKGVLFRASKRAVTMTVKVVCAGQTDRVATQLTGLLGAAVDLIVDAAQQPLFPRTKRPVIQLGAVVVARDSDGETVWGRVHDMDLESSTMLIDVFGATEVPIMMDDVTTSWSLIPGDATEKAIRAYRAACKRAKCTPTFRAITVAVGEHYAGQSPDDGQHRLTDDVVMRAVMLTKEGFSTGDGEQSNPSGDVAPKVTAPVDNSGHRPSVPEQA